MEPKACTARSNLEQMLIDENPQPKALPLSLLEDITGDFSDEQVIGRGGFAVVYKGKLFDRAVAVKRLSNAFMDEKEFHREVECLMRVKHKNVVRFLGYCADRQGNMEMYDGKLVMADVNQRLLCFEYIAQGSLDKYILDAYREWGMCYEIIKGISEGVQYLHENNIIHLDLKPANIMLDDNMLPKITDFGLSRCFDENQSRHITKNAAGTMGYFAPELRKGGVVARSCDLYSLGVIIIEILTGHRGYEAIEDVLESWRDRLEKSQRDTLCDQIQVCYEIALECRDFNPNKRPASARDIIERLHQIECVQPVRNGQTASASSCTTSGMAATESKGKSKDEPRVLLRASPSEHMHPMLQGMAVPHMRAGPTEVMPWPAQCKEAPPGSAYGLPAAAKITSTYEMVEPTWYLYVSIVKARDLPGVDMAGSLDPYVEVKLGNFKAVTTKYFEQNRNPVWREKFTFPRDHLQSINLEVMVKDKDMLRDSFVGHVVLDLSRVPSRLPHDSRLTPQWYRLVNKDGGDKFGLYGPHGLGEIKLALWFGTQHDDSFPEVWPSNSKVQSLARKGLITNSRSKVYYSIKLMYLKVSVIQAQDLAATEEGQPLAHTIAKVQLGGKIWRTKPGQRTTGSAIPRWNEEFMFVASEPLEDPLVVTVEEENVGDGRDKPIGRAIIALAPPYVSGIDLTKSGSSNWFSLWRGMTAGDMATGGKIQLRLSLETE